jgi:hypothetical protein
VNYKEKKRERNKKIAPLRSFTIFFLRQILLQGNSHQKKNEFDRRGRTQGRDEKRVHFFAEYLKRRGRLKTLAQKVVLWHVITEMNI